MVWLAHFRLRKLIPFPGRQLATLFVAIHALLFVFHYASFLTGTVFLPRSIWYFDGERTIAALNQTFQILLLGTMCFLNGIASRNRRFPEAASWFVPGVLLTGLSLFEYLFFPYWLVPGNLLLVLFGIFLAARSLILVLRYRKDKVKRFCFLLLPVGLGIWACGYYLLDLTPSMNIHGVEPLEETVEVLGIAIALAGTAGYATASMPRPRIGERKFLASVCLTMALAGMLHLAAPVWKATVVDRVGFLWNGFGKEISADIFDGALALRGWSGLDLGPGKRKTIRIWLYATRPLTSDFGFTFQLLDQESGDTVASANRRSGIDARNWTPGILHSVFPRATLRVPEDAQTNRALWLTISFWRIDGEEFTPLSIDSSDRPTLGDTHYRLEEVVFPVPAVNPGPGAVPGEFANGFALQQAAIPGHVRVGQSLDVEFLWSSSGDGKEDWTQFLHFELQADGSFWNVDQYPLGMRLPTRLWYAGMQSGERWSFTVPPDLAAGTYDVYTGLYRLADMQRLEVTLADGRQPGDRRIPLGSIVIEN
ncbi:MAG: hypothetical protein OXF32_00890 [Anaerolineaceae bacterium]|nr:hypothetical protein [Anaerolineaceae bacterium]